MLDQHKGEIGAVIARAWSDAEFKRQLLSEPRRALAEMGVVIPPDLEVEVVEDTPKKVHFRLPSTPLQSQVRERDIDAASSVKVTCRSGNVCASCV